MKVESVLSNPLCSERTAWIYIVFPFMRITIILYLEITDRNFVQKSKPTDRVFFFLVFSWQNIKSDSDTLTENVPDYNL